MRYALLTALFLASPAFAEEMKNYDIVLKDHKFTPDTIEVPAGEKVKFTVANQDATADEFDSMDLKREKVIPGNSTGIVLVGPLKPGEYHFMGEFHEATAQGKVIVK